MKQVNIILYTSDLPNIPINILLSWIIQLTNRDVLSDPADIHPEYINICRSLGIRPKHQQYMTRFIMDVLKMKKKDVKEPENYRIYDVERLLNAEDILADVGIRYDEDDIKDIERSVREIL